MDFCFQFVYNVNNYQFSLSSPPSHISQGSYWEIDPTPLEESSDSISLSGFPRKRKASERVSTILISFSNSEYYTVQKAKAAFIGSIIISLLELYKAVPHFHKLRGEVSD